MLRRRGKILILLSAVTLNKHCEHNCLFPGRSAGAVSGVAGFRCSNPWVRKFGAVFIRPAGFLFEPRRPFSPMMSGYYITTYANVKNYFVDSLSSASWRHRLYNRGNLHEFWRLVCEFWARIHGNLLAGKALRFFGNLKMSSGCCHDGRIMQLQQSSPIAPASRKTIPCLPPPSEAPGSVRKSSSDYCRLRAKPRRHS